VKVYWFLAPSNR